MAKWVHNDARVTRGRALGLALVWAVSLSAGSIFMKNGYIVQGPIADRTAEGVVVEWPNGRVSIPRRFIESVVLEPIEEQKIEQKRALEAQRENAVEQGIVEVVPSSLPADPQGLFPSNRVTGPDTTVTEIPAPAMLPTVELGERHEISTGLTGALPVGWTLRRHESAWIAEGPTQGNAKFRSRIAGTRFTGDVSRRNQLALAKEEAAELFDDWQVIEEGRREVGFQEGYEVWGKAVEGEQELHVRQILAWHGDAVWLFSCVWPAESEGARVVEWCLQTFEFAEIPRAE
jgi:hypothetical protein